MILQLISCVYLWPLQYYYNNFLSLVISEICVTRKSSTLAGVSCVGCQCRQCQFNNGEGRFKFQFNLSRVESSQHNWVVATKTATVERLWKVDISFNAVRALTAVVRPHLAGEHGQAVQESEWDRRYSEVIFTTPQIVDNLKDNP